MHFGWISITCKHKGRRSRKVAFKEKRLKGMEEYQDELDKLDCCDVLLPPEILLNFRAKCSTQIVEVHNSVYPYRKVFNSHHVSDYLKLT